MTYIHADEKAPEARPVTDGVVMRVAGVYEVDPELMGAIGQQEMPLWDTRRIVEGREAQVDFMAGHFASTFLTAGEGPEEPADLSQRDDY